jgi:PST family polysaccharide transporter
VRGFAWSFTGTAGQALLQIISLVVLARLLTPAQFGEAAAAGHVVGLSQLVSQVGVGTALVQRRALDTRQISAAFWFSLLFSTILAAAVFALSPILNRLVGLPGQSSLMRLFTVVLVLAGLAEIPMSLLQRELRFRPMAVVDLIAFGPGTIGVSVALAAAHWGASSIVWGQIVGEVITVVGYYLLTLPPLRPQRPAAAWREVRPLLRFGMGYSLSQLGNWFALNADNFVVANVLGPGPLGIYTRAYNLLSQPANVIGGAADKALFPAMAKVSEDGERLRHAYVRSASLVALVTLPSSFLLLVLAPEIVRMLLGGAWLAVIVPLQIFALALLPRASYRISGSLTRATGAVYGGAWRQWLYAGEVLVACAIGSRWGVNGVAVGATVAIVAHFFVMLHFSSRVAPGLMRNVFRMYVKHLPIAAAGLVVAHLAAVYLRTFGSLLVTLAGTTVAWALATGLVLIALRRFFREEAIVVRAIRSGRQPIKDAIEDDDAGSGKATRDAAVEGPGVP